MPVVGHTGFVGGHTSIFPLFSSIELGVDTNGGKLLLIYPNTSIAAVVVRLLCGADRV